jgi:hypothetical protein
LPILLVLGGFGLTALLVPVMTPAAIGDDWVYAVSVFRLIETGELHILDLSVVTLLFQVGWGSLFGLVLGPTFGALRLSTVVATLIGGWACYGVARELGVDRPASTLAAAAYLFHPLAFVLAYTFMTDPHFTALLMVATFGYVRGLRQPEIDNRALLLGAIVAACAFLVRQQGALIPAAVVVALVVQGRFRINRDSVTLAARIVAIPVVVVALYYAWAYFIHGLPEQQGAFTEQILEAGPGDTATLLGRLVFIGVMYLGFFVLPIAAGALAIVRPAIRQARPLTWAVSAIWLVILVAGIRHFDQLGFEPPPMPRMPYIPQYVGPGGLGPHDLVGNRPWLVSWQALDVLTAVCALTSLGLVFLVVRRLARGGESTPDRTAAVIVLMVLIGQAAGVIPPSFHFRNWIISVDRYLLPLLPLAVCLAVWAVARLPWSRTAAWLVVAGLALISIAGTRDLLVFQHETWRLADWAHGRGVPRQEIDGGAAWGGFYLYEYSLEQNLDQQTPGGPWWTDLFAPATTSDYIVSSSPVEGYDIIFERRISSWLAGQDPHLFLLRRSGHAGPPYRP